MKPMHTVKYICLISAACAVIAGCGSNPQNLISSFEQSCAASGGTYHSIANRCSCSDSSSHCTPKQFCRQFENNNNLVNYDDKDGSCSISALGEQECNSLGGQLNAENKLCVIKEENLHKTCQYQSGMCQCSSYCDEGVICSNYYEQNGTMKIKCSGEPYRKGVQDTANCSDGDSICIEKDSSGIAAKGEVYICENGMFRKNRECPGGCDQYEKKYCMNDCTASDAPKTKCDDNHDYILSCNVYGSYVNNYDGDNATNTKCDYKCYDDDGPRCGECENERDGWSAPQM